MLHITDKKFFGEIIADAIVQVHLNCKNPKTRKSWINAIAKGAATLEGDTTFIHYDVFEQVLLYWSPESNEIYKTDARCECTAFLKGKPCYHRAMARLIKNYTEFQQNPTEIAQIDFADAVFFDEEMSAKEKINLLQLCIAEGRAELKPRVDALSQFVN